MLEGLAVWALFIYLLRMVGMPWNTFTKGFSYLGGGAWLLFVWVGLINFTPMDISGGALVQSPHIQLRPDSANVTGKVSAIHVTPNQKVARGQLIYELDPTQYEISLNLAKAKEQSAKIAFESAQNDIDVAKASYQASLQAEKVANSELASAKVTVAMEQATLKRYQAQNRVAKHTISSNDMDQQRSSVDIAEQRVMALESSLSQKKLDGQKALLAIEHATLQSAAREADWSQAEQQVIKAQWDLNSTQVFAPTDGFVTNFILREGQRVSMMPRLQMYTDEKYVLMRVNHQAIRNVKPGQAAEFATPVYPGKVFSAQVEGIVEATGEAQSNLLGLDESVRATTGKNVQNKHHFVRLKINEPEGYDIPVGSVGLGWISAEKPIGFLSFLDIIRGIIIRMKSQLYFLYSI